MAKKETTFCTNFVNGYLGNATLYPQSRHTMHYNKLDTRANTIKFRHLRAAWEVLWRLSTWQQKRFRTITGMITGILKVLDFIRPSSALVHCRTLPSERIIHQRWLLPGEVRTKRAGQSLETSTSLKQFWAYHESIARFKTVLKGLSIPVLLRLHNLCRGGLFMRPEKAQRLRLTFRLPHLWSGVHHFLSWCKEYNLYYGCNILINQVAV